MIDSLVRDEPMGFYALLVILLLLGFALAVTINRAMQRRAARRLAVSFLKREWTEGE